jgi:hypothetical protein
MIENSTIFDVLAWLNKRNFDIRKRFYETPVNYETRMRATYDAFHISYETWAPLNEFAYICPSFHGDRLPLDKKQLGSHECYYLRIQDILPENWVVPTRKLETKIAELLPRRATYRAQNGDILLSRFREPLGKCVVYLGGSLPLYVSSNYLLIRPKSNYSARLLLGLMKSPFIACQLHKIIRPRTVITEMFIYEARQIRLPHMSSNGVEGIENLTEHRIYLEDQIKALSHHKTLDNQEKNNKAWFETLSDIEMKITQIVLNGI